MIYLLFFDDIKKIKLLKIGKYFDIIIYLFISCFIQM